MLNRIKSLSRSLALLIFFALVAATTLMTTHTTEAKFRQAHYIYYYTDASHTTMCGWYVLPCNNGGSHSSGCVTEFSEDEWYDC